MKTSKLSTDISHFRDAHDFSYCPNPHNSSFGKILELVKEKGDNNNLYYPSRILIQFKDSGYSKYKYDLQAATINDIIYPSLDPCIFEVKYPNVDIKGQIVT